VNGDGNLPPLIFLTIVFQACTLFAILMDRRAGRTRLPLHNLGAGLATGMLLLALTWGHLGVTIAAIVALSGWFALLHRRRDHERQIARAVERALRDGSLMRGPAPLERPERHDGDGER
jgi:hypothetical protein